MRLNYVKSLLFTMLYICNTYFTVNFSIYITKTIQL